MQRLVIAAFLAAALMAPSAGAAGERKTEVPAEKPGLQPLWPDGAPDAKGSAAADVPGVIVYLPAKDKANGAAVVICPGGGYGGLAIDHEGHQIARWLNSLGIAGVIVKYRLSPYRHPIPLTDASRAVRYTRARAKEWNIDPTRVGILGFSAGGHLASTVATHFDAGQKDAKDPIDTQSSRPDFAILVYPVITFTNPYTHAGSRSNLLGPNPDPKLIEELSNEKQVTKQTPPTFLVHTTQDTAVPPQNSLLFYDALSKQHVPAELHIYEKGQHGLGLGGRDTAFSSWPDRCAAWLRGRGFMTSPKE